jgi:outer membrane protein assembly factor BamB
MPAFTLFPQRASRMATASLACFLAFGTITAQSTDWPQFLGPHRDGSSDEKGVATVWPAEGPRPVWKKKIGGGWSAPVLSAGKLVIFHRQGDKEVLQCLDAKSGKELWTTEHPTAYSDDFGFDDGPRATPCVAGNKVYSMGAEGALGCTDLKDGKRLWSIETKKDFGTPKGFFGVACSPLVESNKVLVNIGGRNAAGIVALDKDTGKLLWKATDAEASYSSPAAAAIGDKRYVFFFNREGLVAVEPSTGKVYFEYPWKPPIHAAVNAATPLIIGDLIFISTSYGRGATVLRFKESGPEPLWAEDDVLSNHYATSVHQNGLLFGFDGRQEQGPRLRCVELKTGKVRWTENGLGAGTVTLVNGNLLILTERGVLLSAPAVAQGFKPTARAQAFPFDVRAYPALADGYFYARSKNELTCIDLRKQP